MKLSPPVLRLAILAVFTVFFATPTRSFADTYQVFNLGSDQGNFFYGMNDSGLVVVDHPDAPACGFSTCYSSFLNGSSTGISATAPTFTADDGTSCTPAVPAGGSVQHGVCNNGRDAFSGFLSSGQMRPSIYVGPTFQDIFNNGGEGFIFMNSLGDIVFDDAYTEDWYEAVDLTTITPEPGSLILLATGLLALAIPFRRRLSA